MNFRTITDLSPCSLYANQTQLAKQMFASVQRLSFETVRAILVFVRFQPLQTHHICIFLQLNSITLESHKYKLIDCKVWGTLTLGYICKRSFIVAYVSLCAWSEGRRQYIALSWQPPYLTSRCTVISPKGVDEKRFSNSKRCKWEYFILLLEVIVPFQQRVLYWQEMFTERYLLIIYCGYINNIPT